MMETLQVVSSVLSTVAAIAAVVVAFLAYQATKIQAYYARRGLSYSLYDRRLPIYIATRRILATSANSYDHTQKFKLLTEFLQATAELNFILPKPLVKIVDDARTLALDIQRNITKFDTAATRRDTAESEKYAEEDEKLMERLMDLEAAIEPAFAKFMDFSDV